MARNSMILFNRLGLESMVKIGIHSFEAHSNHFVDKSGIALEFRDLDKLMTMLILSLGPNITSKRVKQKLPDAFLGKITRRVRESGGFPKKVVFKVTKEASRFVDKLKGDNDILLQLYKRNETVNLSWKEYMRGSTLFLSVDKARRSKVPVAEELARAARPRIEFSSIGFQDIAGNKATKNTLKQIIKLLKNPVLVERFGLDLPKGMLLYGPPGVGKTMLGKAFAKETGRPYVYASRSDLFDPDHIRKAYQKAREYAPSIVFLDGIDVKGLMEGVYTTMPDDQLLLEIDSLTTGPDNLVFTLATAQNRFEVPPAILAPNRIDTFVEVPELDREARRFFIDKILEKPNDGKINVERVIRYISGMSGYDLQRIGKEASLHAIRNGLDCLTEDILIEQINIIKYGYKLEKKHIRNLEDDLRITAFHEAGHAVLSFLLLPDIKIEQVTIAPRLQTLGFISYTPEDFPGNISRDEIFNNICVLVAGRVASIKKFGRQGLNTGAANDLEQATHQAYAAVASLGMDDKIGYVHTDTLSQNVSKQIFLTQVEEQVQQWLKEATDRATQLVEQHWKRIEKLAAILIQHEIVDGADLERVMKEDD
jgi:ATP-dependent Zn protease